MYNTPAGHFNMSSFFIRIIAYKFIIINYKFIRIHCCCIHVCLVCVLDNINVTSGNEVSRS